MSNEGDTDKRKVNLRIRIETVRKAIRGYAHDGDDGDAPALVRALDFATQDIALTAEDYRLIAEEVEANERKRMEKREAKKRGAK